MLEVSDDAMRICRETVRQLSGTQAKTKYLRLTKEDDCVSIALEVPKSDDQIVKHHGQPIIAVPEGFADMLSSRTLDVRTDGAFVLT